jgi:hypothetical protein
MYGQVPAGYSARNVAPNKNAASSVADVSLTLTSQQQDLVKAQLTSDLLAWPSSDLRARYTMMDLAYSMEAACDTPQKKMSVNQEMNILYKDVELPVIQPNLDASHTYLTSTFLSGTPIFGVVADEPGQTEAARQLESIIYENAESTGWTRQLQMYFKSALKYNVSALEIDWIVRRTFNPITDTRAGGNLQQAGIQEIYRGGNELKSLDMYNTFMDISVPAADVHIRGDYVGSIERMSLMQLYDLITTLKLNGGQTMNIGDRLWCSQPARNMFHIPTILPVGKIGGVNNWASWLSNASSAPLRTNSGSSYEVITYYRRIIPSMLKITSVPDKDSVQIWKFIEVNGLIVYAERKSNAHNQHPIIFCQPTEDNLRYQTKGPGQNLYNYQNLAGSMFRARLASLARSISDRGLFDPARVNLKDINSTNPAAKIPVRPGAFGAKISDAYYPIPFDDRNSQNIYGDIGQVMQWGSDSSGVNKAQRGQFTKGNRTLEEFDTIMINADSKQQSMAMLIEAQAMVPLKQQIKVNTLQYQSATSLPHPNTKKVVEVNPVDLRKATLQFKIADGLLPKDKIMGIGPTMEAAQFLLQVPQPPPEDTTTPRYDIIGMVVEAMNAKGARLNLHRINPPQAAQPGAAPPAQAPAQVPGQVV